MSFGIYITIICIASALIASQMDVVTDVELKEDPWKKESM